MDQLLNLLVGIGWVYLVATILTLIMFVVVAVISIKSFIDFDKRRIK